MAELGFVDKLGNWMLQWTFETSPNFSLLFSIIDSEHNV